ncbi:MAG: NAD(P)-binding protein [Tepidisphaera sp.]|nr:NAD(P)-binding protein [Tepidisphaera sp.]
MTERRDVLVLGAGLTGLAAASLLGERATVLERESRPGGLVRTERLGDYWFDHVVHLLYFQDAETERCIRDLMGDLLAPCPPRAWVETTRGTARFPIQLHLNGLDSETCVACLRDMAELTFRPPAAKPTNFEEMLELTFGKALCDVFMFPYNRKMWKRPLNELAPSGFTWNIARPDFEKVLRGAVSPTTRAPAYNSAGWYPRPEEGAPVRGMELMPIALAEKAADLRLQHTVTSVDLDDQSVTVRCGGGPEAPTIQVGYNEAMLSSLPLPTLVRICEQAPPELKERCERLTWNRVVSVALAIRGPRPEAPGHWRYYSDESMVFTRLIFMHEFDPMCAPPEGWSLLVEITQPAEEPMPDADTLIARVLADVARVGFLPPGSEVVASKMWEVNPAYVVFSLQNQQIIEDAINFLEAYRVTSLGRYGSWEYSGMSSCLYDGFQWAAEFLRFNPPALDVVVPREKDLVRDGETRENA